MSIPSVWTKENPWSTANVWKTPTRNPYDSIAGSVWNDFLRGDDDENAWWNVFEKWTDESRNRQLSSQNLAFSPTSFGDLSQSFVADPYLPDWGRGVQPFTPIGATSSETIQANLDRYSGGSKTAQLGELGGTVGANSTATGLPGWEGVDKWNNEIINAQAKVYQELGIFVPGNLIKAIMKLESGGVWTDSDPGAGAIGVMQVMPFWASSLGLDLLDPAQNVLAGVKILAMNYQTGDLAGNPSWEWAARRYLGLDPGGDAYGTTHDTYWQRVKADWNALNTAVVYGPGYEGTVAPGGGMPNDDLFWSITKGNPFPVTQEYGITDWSNGQGKYMYGYSTALGWPDGNAHPGLDVGTPQGTNLYSPVRGVVEVAGPERRFLYNGQADRPQSGGLWIRLENGDVLILGHMYSIDVKVGDVINPGQFVGLSGAENGDHVHVEYRRPNPAGGELSVDPRLALNGIFSGTYSNATIYGDIERVSTSDNWLQFMRAVATGKPISGYSGVTGDAYHDYLARGVKQGWDFAAQQGVPGSNTIAYTWGIQFGQQGDWTKAANDIDSGDMMTGD